MDTSKDYYEAVMRDYIAYRRGRTLARYCMDEGVDYQWLKDAKKQYGEIDEYFKKKKVFRPSKVRHPEPAATPDMIELRYEGDSSEITDSAKSSPELGEAAAALEQAANWAVASLRLSTPLGGEIEITSRNTAAVLELLSKLAL